MVFLWSLMPSFSNFHFNFNEQAFVSFLNSITLSLIRIGVSFGFVFGLVDFGSKPASPHLLYSVSHLSRLLWLWGQTLIASFNLISLLLMGSIHLNLSSLIVFAIFIHIFPS